VGQRVPSFRPPQPGSQQAAMFYATAGQQATHRGAGAGGVSVGGGFPPIAAIGRGAPPGFATRGAGECFLARGEGRAGAGLRSSRKSPEENPFAGADMCSARSERLPRARLPSFTFQHDLRRPNPAFPALQHLESTSSTRPADVHAATTDGRIGTPSTTWNSGTRGFTLESGEWDDGEFERRRFPSFRSGARRERTSGW